MKKFTKHIVILLMFSFIISTPLNVFAKDLDKKSEIGTKVLLKAGFTQSEISDLPKSELEAYADAQSITINDEYYRITYTKELNGQTTKKRHKISKEQSEKEMASNSVYTFANNRAISKKWLVTQCIH